MVAFIVIYINNKKLHSRTDSLKEMPNGRRSGEGKGAVGIINLKLDGKEGWITLK